MLLNVSYKTLAKAIVRKSKLLILMVVQPTQKNLSKEGLFLTISTYLDRELSGLINLQKKTLGLKIKFEKAYNKIKRDFIIIMLDQQDLGNFLPQLWQLFSSKIPLLENPSKPINLLKSICHGCPLSPYLYMIIANTLGFIRSNQNAMKRQRNFSTMWWIIS